MGVSYAEAYREATRTQESNEKSKKSKKEIKDFIRINKFLAFQSLQVKWFASEIQKGTNDCSLLEAGVRLTKGQVK